MMLRERLGELLPEGVAIGSDGGPTRDPALARRGGALLPFGGYKGFGLALMVQALGVLAESGSGIARDCWIAARELARRPIDRSRRRGGIVSLQQPGHQRRDSNRSLPTFEPVSVRGNSAGKRFGEARDWAGIFSDIGRFRATETVLSPLSGGKAAEC
jgi:Malate/L-lactate dehydrogenase